MPRKRQDVRILSTGNPPDSPQEQAAWSTADAASRCSDVNEMVAVRTGTPAKSGLTALRYAGYAVPEPAEATSVGSKLTDIVDRWGLRSLGDLCERTRAG
jgi:hypothetical protein